MKRAIHSALASILQSQDTEEFRQILQGEEYQLEEISGDNWKSVRETFQAPEQRALLGTCLLTYLHCRGCDIQSGEPAVTVRMGLLLSERFVELISASFEFLPGDLMQRCPPINLVLDPPPDLSEWTTKVVTLAHKDGQYVERVKVEDLDSTEYEHPLDRKLLTALQNTAGFDTLAHKFQEFGIEPILRIRCAGTNIKVTERNFPDLHRKIRSACEILGISKVPDLYITVF